MNRPTVRSRRRGVAGAVLALWWSLAPGIGSAAEQKPAAPPEPPQPPVYVPPDVGAPSTRVIGGVRGIDIGGFPIVLAPEFTGLTTKAQPTLYWYLGQPQARLALRLTDEAKPETAPPLLEADIASVLPSGLYATALAEYGAVLEPNRLYRWHVLTVTESEQGRMDLGSSATIKRVGPDPRLRAALEGASVQTQVAALARHGFWYDALDLLSQQISRGDESAPWQELRANLLDQVGLAAAAAYDSQAAAARE